MSTSLETLFTDSKKITIGEKEIEIRNVCLGDLPVLIKIISKVFELKPNFKNKQHEIAKAVVEHFDDVLSLFLITTDLKMEDIKKLNVAAATYILGEVISENADFFTKSVVPLLANLTEKIPTTGQSKSKS